MVTNATPMYLYTGTRPSGKCLPVFGCCVIVHLPGDQPAKLDYHTASGIFLGYTATDNNIKILLLPQSKSLPMPF